MRGRLLIGFSILVLLFTAACENPFFPEKRGRENPDIISVSVTPDSANVVRGETKQFSAEVENSNNQNVTWSIAGDVLHIGTTIDTDGLLTVSVNETPGIKIIVTAVSDANKTKSGSAVVTVIDKTIYSILIDYRDDETGDTVTANPAESFEGKEITLSYTVINNGKTNNRLHFSGTNERIEDVTTAGNGTRIYIINPNDAIDSVITIITTFTHTNLTIDEISFTDNSPIIVKTYGDAPFTNAVKPGHLGTGVITYSSEDEDVAAVNNSGVVTIKKAGTTVITAQKAADAVYAHASASYTLDVEHKTITITGVTRVDRDFILGDRTVVISGGTLVGVVSGDNVSAVVPSTGTMTNAYPGNAKPITITTITLTGSDVGNYSLTQPVVTVNITKSAILVEMLEEIAANMEEIIGSTPRSFQMGQCASGNNVTPVHTVTLTQSYKMSKYQVTQEQNTAVNNPSLFTEEQVGELPHL